MKRLGPLAAAALVLLHVACGWLTPTEAWRWAWRAMLEGRGGDE